MLESICDELKEDTVIGNVDVPLLDCTLEQMNFMLNAGNKLKAQGKLNFKTPPVKISKQTPSTPSEIAEINKENVKSTFSTPKTSLGIMQKINCAEMSRGSSRSAKKMKQEQI